MQTLTRNWKIFLGLNLILGIVQIIGMYTDIEFESPYLNFFFPIIITFLAIISVIKVLKSKFSVDWLLASLCLPSLVSSLPYFVLFLIMLTPGGWYVAAVQANEFNARSIRGEFPSPDGTKIAIIYYTPPMEGGNIGIHIKLKYRFIPLVVRSLYEDSIYFDWNSPWNPNFEYKLVWIDNKNIEVKEIQKLSSINRVRPAKPKVFLVT